MALDKNTIQNKMMTAAPAKKEFHFAATVEHYAEVVYAQTIQEAEAIYHKVKRTIPVVLGGADLTPPEQSTGAVDQEIKE